jgi:cell division protein FtsA
MARRSKIHVGIGIGTSKTCLVVGEVKPDSAIKILGIGETKSAGVRKGEIFDYAQTRACLRDALSRTERYRRHGCLHGASAGLLPTCCVG